MGRLHCQGNGAVLGMRFFEAGQWRSVVDARVQPGVERCKDNEDCDSSAQLLTREVVKVEVLASIDSTQSCLFCRVGKVVEVTGYSRKRLRRDIEVLLIVEVEL